MISQTLNVIIKNIKEHKKELIITICILIISGMISYLLNYEKLVAYRVVMLYVAGIAAVIDLIFVSKDKKIPYLALIAATLFLLIVFIDKRISKLEPINSAEAHLELNIKPVKIEIQKNPWYGWITLPKDKQAPIFMIAKNPPELWGAKGGQIDHIKLDFKLDVDSPFAGKPLSSIENNKVIQFYIFINRRIEVISGRCVFTFNGVKKKELSIPTQTPTFFNEIYAPINWR